MLGQDKMFQFPVRSSELQVETRSDRAEDAHTAQRNNRESASLEGRVDVGLEVEIVLVILKHPESEIGYDKRLGYHQDFYGTRNVSSWSFDMLARTLPPELEALSSESRQSR